LLSLGYPYHFAEKEAEKSTDSNELDNRKSLVASFSQQSKELRLNNAV
jgi:hypothetical protein